MKIILISALLLQLTMFAYGQELLVKTEKTTYKIDETITVVFEINAKVDSVGQFFENNFRILNKPSQSSQSSTVNGETSYFFSVTYELKAIVPGKIEIISPIFYLENREQKTEKLMLTISGSKLNQQEIEDINFKVFVDSAIKPNGTLRYVIAGNFGYVEEYNEAQWIYKRRLSKREVKRMGKR
jgi:hypothetical protein